MSSTRLFLLLGSVSGALAVILGAFGAHALRGHLTPDLLSTYHTATQYQMYHSLALLLVALLAAQLPAVTLWRVAGWLFVAGILLFSGSLYALSLTGVRWLGAITPFGGLAFIAGWGTLVLAAARRG